MTINKAKPWLADAHQWLHAFGELAGHRSLRSFIRKMDSARKDGDFSQTQLLVAQVKEISEKLNAMQSAETNERSMALAECAYALYETGDIFGARQLLRESLEHCDRSDGGHFEGTVQWMLGCMQWELDEIADAVVLWEAALATYGGLMRQSANYPSQSTTNWYSEKSTIMTSRMDEALGDTQKPPSSTPFDSGAAPEKTDGGAVQDEMPSFQQQDILQLFNVFNEIRAGPPGSTNGHGGSIGEIEVDQFQINGRPYRMINLRGAGRVIKYSSGYEYRVIRVVGDSMDAERIDHGDYVLLRIQSNPENNDIVAAKIQDVDTTATLKKFIKKQDHIILRFSSRNPAHWEADGRDKEYVYSLKDQRFEVIGVALAVFKPI